VLTLLARLLRTISSSSRTRCFSRSFSRLTVSSSCRCSARSSYRGVVGMLLGFADPGVAVVAAAKLLLAPAVDEIGVTGARPRAPAVGAAPLMLVELERGLAPAPAPPAAAPAAAPKPVLALLLLRWRPPAEVELVVDATEAECARSWESSRVRRLTCTCSSLVSYTSLLILLLLETPHRILGDVPRLLALSRVPGGSRPR
jgi:hypothetical protein